MNRRSSRITLLLVTTVNLILLTVVYFWLVAPHASSQVSETQGTVAADVREKGGNAAYPPTATPIPLIRIVVAVQPIARGQTLSPDMIDYRIWPEEFAPRNALFDLDDVIGRIAATDIVREQPILSRMVASSLSELGAVGSDMAAVLPRGTVSKTIYIPVNDLPAGLATGDRVDLFYTDKSEPETTYQVTTYLAISNGLVVWMGDFPPDGNLFRGFVPTLIPIPYDTQNMQLQKQYQPTTTPYPSDRPLAVTLAISPQDAAILIWLEESEASFTIVLRPAASTVDISQVQPVDQDYLRRRFIPPTAVPAVSTTPTLMP